MASRRLLLLVLTVLGEVTTFGRFQTDLQYSCPRRMHLYKTWCFFYTNEVASHPVAESRCKNHGGQLAVPKDMSTQLFIKNITFGGRYDSYWIGLREIKNSWVYGDGTSLGAFTYWAPHEPGGARDEDCVLLASAYMTKWVTTQCHWGYRFICQINAGCNVTELGNRHLTLINDTSQSPIIPIGEKVSVKCAEGHGVISGPTEIQCQESRQWSTETTCVPGCPPPVLPRSMHLTQSRRFFHVGETPSLECAEGFLLTNPGLTCNAEGKWIGRSPECRPQGDTAANFPCIATPTVRVTRAKMSEPEVKTVVSGGTLSVTCLPNDRRTPNTWIWMKEQRVLERPDSNIPHVRVHNNGTLHITRMTAEAEGSYSCVAESLTEKGQVVDRTLQIYLPKTCQVPLEIGLEEKYHISIGEDHVLLRCFASDTITTWYLGKTHLLSNERHRILPNGALLVRKSLLLGTAIFRCVVEHLHTRCRTEQETAVYTGKINLDAICGRVDVHPDESNSSSLIHHGKIVGGHEADKGTHPWVVMFTTLYKNQEKFLCAGNLVSSRWVVSAAHCFYWVDSADKLRSLQAKLGKYDRTEPEEGEKVMGLARVIVHASFDKTLRSFDHDIALVKLEKDVTFGDKIVPICIPTQEFLDDFYPVQYSRSSGLVSGWGRLQEDGIQPRYMHQVRLPLVDQELCSASTDQPVTANMFCAGYSQAVGDSCQGDSGGPFEISRHDQVYLAGIVSWGEGCSQPSKYGFYTRIGNYRHYILKHIYEY